MNSVRENLIAAKALIAEPGKWVQGTYSNGQGCFCAMGAIRRVVGGDWSRMSALEEVLERELDASFVAETEALDPDLRLIPHFNDTHEHSDVVALFDRAIAAQDTP